MLVSLIDENGNYVTPMAHAAPPAPAGIGAGSPEGVKRAYPPATYWDQTNNVLYVKDTGNGTTTGWVAV